MTNVISLPIDSWDHLCSKAEQDCAIRALEHGTVLLLPQLPFLLGDSERQLLSPTIAGDGKNVSLDPSTGRLRGSSANEADLKVLLGMTTRFASYSNALLRQLLPRYEAGLRQGRTSFRPVEIVGRSTSWRKDDTRLHVDSFPSTPTRGNRILRMFTNVNPFGQARRWRLGESFESMAHRHLPSLPNPIWGVNYALNFLGITKSRRSAYDHFMLRLHDQMKADAAYQAEAMQSVHEFQPGSTWIVFTDQVSHAAMVGQHVLEQTFYLPVECMQDPSLAPLRVLERLLGRALI
jgi:3-deoxy-D-manno-oct-2-ulosonic acid (Kdo) hydroxylase